MAMDALRCDHLAPLGFKGLTVDVVNVAEMPFIGWLALGVTGGLISFAMIGLLFFYAIARQRRNQRQPLTSPASLTTDVDDENGSVSDSDVGSCSPVQDIIVSQSTPDFIGHDGGGYLATGRAPDVIDRAFHLL